MPQKNINGAITLVPKKNAKYERTVYIKDIDDNEIKIDFYNEKISVLEHVLEVELYITIWDYMIDTMHWYHNEIIKEDIGDTKIFEDVYKMFILNDTISDVCKKEYGFDENISLKYFLSNYVRVVDENYSGYVVYTEPLRAVKVVEKINGVNIVHEIKYENFEFVNLKTHVINAMKDIENDGLYDDTNEFLNYIRSNDGIEKII